MAISRDAIRDYPGHRSGETKERLRGGEITVFAEHHVYQGAVAEPGNSPSLGSISGEAMRRPSSLSLHKRDLAHSHFLLRCFNSDRLMRERRRGGRGGTNRPFACRGSGRAEPAV